MKGKPLNCTHTSEHVHTGLYRPDQMLLTPQSTNCPRYTWCLSWSVFVKLSRLDQIAKLPNIAPFWCLSTSAHDERLRSVEVLFAMNVRRQVTNHGLVTDMLNGPKKYTQGERDLSQLPIFKLTLQFLTCVFYSLTSMIFFQNSILKWYTNSWSQAITPYLLMCILTLRRKSGCTWLKKGVFFINTDFHNHWWLRFT